MSSNDFSPARKPVLDQNPPSIGLKLASSIEILLIDLEAYFRTKTPATSFLNADTAKEGAHALELLIEILGTLVAQIKATDFKKSG